MSYTRHATPIDGQPHNNVHNKSVHELSFIAISTSCFHGNYSSLKAMCNSKLRQPKYNKRLDKGRHWTFIIWSKEQSFNVRCKQNQFDRGSQKHSNVSVCFFCNLPRNCSLLRLHSAAAAVWLVFGWVSVTFVYCVETAKDTARVAIECEKKTVYSSLRTVPFSMTLSDL